MAGAKKAAAKPIGAAELQAAFSRYVASLRKIALEDKTEHTDRSALEHLLQTVASFVKESILVQHEPKRVQGKGAPDFKVADGGLILGYVENKAIGEKLLKIIKSDQIKKYLELSNNIIVTDYLDFYLL